VCSGCGVVLLRDRQELYERIDRRVAAMFAEGVVEEVAGIGSIGQTASQTLGFAEIRRLIAGETTREDCIAAIQQATRRYAKRQLTWFKREQGLRTLELGERFSVKALAAVLREGLREREAAAET
jgi:tRNA dimethylallyltransferase